MINSKIFFKGLKSLIGVRSPAIPLAACFIALGALLKDAGLNIHQSAASSFFGLQREGGCWRNIGSESPGTGGCCHKSIQSLAAWIHPSSWKTASDQW